MDAAALPRIAIFALGGTIATVVDSEGRNATLGLDAVQVLAAVPSVASVAEVSATTFRAVMSSALSFTDVIELAGAIDSSDADGVVVTMGTDSLEEVAFLLDATVASDLPVVVTGAMRNAGKPGADGPANLLAAVQVAASPLARGLGTLVVLNDEIHAARFVSKRHASSPATFTSPGLGAIGWVSEGRIRIPLAPTSRSRRYAVDGDVPAVALVTLSLGDDGRMISALPSLGYAGAVVEVFGAGHVSPDLVRPLTELATNMPVVFASRTGAGELYSSTGTFPGSETDLLNAGLVSAGALDGLKARALLSVLIATREPDIAAAFAAH
jgi:L-asparaginase